VQHFERWNKRELPNCGTAAGGPGQGRGRIFRSQRGRKKILHRILMLCITTSVFHHSLHLLSAGLPAIVLTIFLTACATHGPAPKRVASVIELRPEKEVLYRKLHAEPSPEVLEVMREANLRNFSIYLREIDGRKLLFAYFEHHGRDFEGDMAKLGASPVTKDWHQLTNPCQRPIPGAARGEWWSGMEEVFHMP